MFMVDMIAEERRRSEDIQYRVAAFEFWQQGTTKSKRFDEYLRNLGLVKDDQKMSVDEKKKTIDRVNAMVEKIRQSRNK